LVERRILNRRVGEDEGRRIHRLPPIRRWVGHQIAIAIAVCLVETAVRAVLRIRRRSQFEPEDNEERQGSCRGADARCHGRSAVLAVCIWKAGRDGDIGKASLRLRKFEDYLSLCSVNNASLTSLIPLVTRLSFSCTSPIFRVAAGLREAPRMFLAGT